MRLEIRKVAGGGGSSHLRLKRGRHVFVARLQCASEDEPIGYAPKVLDAWAQRAKAWAKGEMPADLPLIGEPAEARPRDVFIFMINGFKPKAPAAAKALLERLG